MSYEIIKVPNGISIEFSKDTVPLSLLQALSQALSIEIKDKNYKSLIISSPSLLKIINHTYEDIVKYDNKGNKITYKRTTLTFDDGSMTSVEAPADKADPYMGFYICYAKRMAGNDNTINDVAEHWIEDVPKKKAKEKAEADRREKEEQRIQERDKKRREKKRIRLEAIRRKEQYDAAKLANEKYGVPMDFKNNKENT